MSEEKKDYSVTDFSVVVVKKDDLVTKLKENLEKHNAIYETACSGYWIESQKVLEDKKKGFSESVEKLQRSFEFQYAEKTKSVEEKKTNIGGFSVGLQFDAYWPLKYPENHAEDYERVISMMELSVADKVELSSSDFDCYVRNNWQWKKQFVDSSLNFVNSYALNTTGFAGKALLISGGNITTDSFARSFASSAGKAF